MLYKHYRYLLVAYQVSRYLPGGLTWSYQKQVLNRAQQFNTPNSGLVRLV